MDGWYALILETSVITHQILLADVDGEVLAVSNKCSHLGLPLVGKVSNLLAILHGTSSRQGHKMKGLQEKLSIR